MAPVTKIVVYFGLLVALLISPFVAPLASASPTSLFLQAREAASKGQAERLAKLARKIPAHYPLTPYLAWWQLGENGKDPDALRTFAEKFAHTPLADRAYRRLLSLQATAERWPEAIAAGKALNGVDRDSECLLLTARVNLRDTHAIQDARTRFVSDRRQPDACETLFRHMRSQGQIFDADVYARLRTALSDAQTNLGRETMELLPETEREPFETLRRAAQGDGGVIRILPTASRSQRELGLFALYQLAKNDLSTAITLWESAGMMYSENERRHGWGQIAIVAARQHEARSLELFRRMGAPLTVLQHEWKARSLLRLQRWAELYLALQAMPNELQEEPVWRYWKARAMQGMGAHAAAQQLLANLTHEFNYYGLLAQEALPERLQNRTEWAPLTDTELRFAEQHEGLKRALLLRKLKLDDDALAEWNWALHGMTDRQLLASAELARRARWYDRAISTAERTREMHSLDLRYVTPYRDLAEAYAKENGLDVAWVYGLMRQESRFVEYARSRVGAGGLMQIMPATARWIGHQIGAQRKVVNRVGLPKNNIRFGTWYLKRLYSGLGDSAVLATAAYNAGPGRARKWQTATPLEGAIYVETIPFLETRQYVKKVLANAMFYAERLGGPQITLKDRLGTVPARSDAPLPDDETTPAID